MAKTRLENYRIAEAHSRETSFLANVIQHQHQNPARKLKGLVNLLEADHTVKIAQHSIDTLLIDGEVADWIALEEAAKVSRETSKGGTAR